MSKPDTTQPDLRELLCENREDHARARRLLVNGNINVGDWEKLEKVADSRAIEAITANTNKQIAEVLDRLESEMNRYTAGHDVPMRDEALEAIQAERTKLKRGEIV